MQVLNKKIDDAIEKYNAKMEGTLTAKFEKNEQKTIEFLQR